MLSLHLALPREGHLKEVFHIFAYLKKHHNTEMVFDPSDPVIDEFAFKRKDWTSSEFGLIDEQKKLPPQMPEPRGKGFVIKTKVDANHAANTIMQQSRTGFIIFINCAPLF